MLESHVMLIMTLMISKKISGLLHWLHISGYLDHKLLNMCSVFRKSACPFGQVKTNVLAQKPSFLNNLSQAVKSMLVVDYICLELLISIKVDQC